MDRRAEKRHDGRQKGGGWPESRRRRDFGGRVGGRMPVGTCRRIPSSSPSSTLLHECSTCRGDSHGWERKQPELGKGNGGRKNSWKLPSSPKQRGDLLFNISAGPGRAGVGGTRFRQPHGDTLPVQVKAVAPGGPRSVDVATLLLRSLTRPLDEPRTVGVAKAAGPGGQSPSASKDSAGLSRVGVAPAAPRREGIRPPRRVRHGCRLTRLARVGGEHRAASPSSRRGVSSGQISQPLATQAMVELLRAPGTLTQAVPLLRRPPRDSFSSHFPSHPPSHALTHPRGDGLVSTAVPLIRPSQDGFHNWQQPGGLHFWVPTRGS